MVTSHTAIYTLSLHDALPISNHSALLSVEQFAELAETLGADPDDPWVGFETGSPEAELCSAAAARLEREPLREVEPPPVDRKSTRLNSSHSQISYAVFCLKKK